MPETQEEKDKKIVQAVADLRAEFEKVTPDLVKIEKIEEFIEKQEDENQNLVTKLEAAKSEAEEQKERLDELEIELSRKGGPGDGLKYQESDEYKALTKFCQYGMDHELKAVLRTDIDAQGGVLVMNEMDTTMIKNIVEISAVRSVARVRTIGSKGIDIPKRTGRPIAIYEGEAEEGVEDNMTYGSESITTFRQSVTIPITQDMLMNSAFNMESEIMMDASESFAEGEGAGFVAGTGFKQPAGIISNATLQAAARPSSTSGDIEAEDVILLTGDLKVGYNPVYLMNRLTLALLRTKKSAADGVFLWQPGLNGPVANTINGFNYLIVPDMQDVASDSFSIAFGDFRRGYTIIDRTGMSVVRDDVTRKKEAIIEFTLNRWNTGQVTQTEAIKLLQTLT